MKWLMPSVEWPFAAHRTFTLVLYCLCFSAADSCSLQFTVTRWAPCLEPRKEFLTLHGISVEQCVCECAMRPDCESLGYKSKGKLAICQMHFEGGLHVKLGDGANTCVFFRRRDMDLKEIDTVCTCSYGQTCGLNTGQCVFKECKRLTLINGYVYGNARQLNARVRVRCNAGYIESNGMVESTCTPDGNWSYTPSCILQPLAATSTITSTITTTNDATTAMTEETTTKAISSEVTTSTEAITTTTKSTTSTKETTEVIATTTETKTTTNSTATTEVATSQVTTIQAAKTEVTTIIEATTTEVITTDSTTVTIPSEAVVAEVIATIEVATFKATTTLPEASTTDAITSYIRETTDVTTTTEAITATTTSEGTTGEVPTAGLEATTTEETTTEPEEITEAISTTESTTSTAATTTTEPYTTATTEATTSTETALTTANATATTEVATSEATTLSTEATTTKATNSTEATTTTNALTTTETIVSTEAATTTNAITTTETTTTETIVSTEATATIEAATTAELKTTETSAKTAKATEEVITLGSIINSATGAELGTVCPSVSGDWIHPIYEPTIDVMFSKTNVKQAAASTECARLGSGLVKIDEEWKQRFLADSLFNCAGYSSTCYWIDGTKVGSTWQFSDSSVMPTGNGVFWDIGEPRTSGVDCVAINTNQRWVTMNCNNKCGYICELLYM